MASVFLVFSVMAPVFLPFSVMEPLFLPYSVHLLQLYYRSADSTLLSLASLPSWFRNWKVSRGKKLGLLVPMQDASFRTPHTQTTPGQHERRSTNEATSKSSEIGAVITIAEFPVNKVAANPQHEALRKRNLSTKMTQSLPRPYASAYFIQRYRHFILPKSQASLQPPNCLNPPPQNHKILLEAR